MNDSVTDSSSLAGTDSTQRIAQAVSHWRMVTPALLFLVSHRPLAFVAGQFLYALQPFADLFDVSECADFASMLTAPDGSDRLVAILAEAGTHSGSVPRSDAT